MKPFRVSRELLYLVIEQAASDAAKRYVEGAFAVQFPRMTLDLGDANIGFNAIESDDFDLRIDGIDIEWVD